MRGSDGLRWLLGCCANVAAFHLLALKVEKAETALNQKAKTRQHSGIWECGSGQLLLFSTGSDRHINTGATCGIFFAIGTWKGGDDSEERSPIGWRLGSGIANSSMISLTLSEK